MSNELPAPIHVHAVQSIFQKIYGLQFLGKTLVQHMSDIGQELGRLEPGRLADMLLLDYHKMCHPFVDPSQDPIDVLLYRGLGKHVHTVMVNGRIVVRDGKLLTIDEEAIAGRLADAASWPRTEKEKALFKAMDELKHHVIRYYEGWPRKIKAKPYFEVNSRTDGKIQ